jgi:hypothetical protein
LNVQESKTEAFLMLDKTINSEMLMDLSDEQQELISGGYDSAFSSTYFSERIKAIETFSASGRDGSVAGGKALSADLNTSGYNSISLDIPYYY